MTVGIIWNQDSLLCQFNQQGAVAPLQVYCQRRHLQSVVIPDLISLAYLQISGLNCWPSCHLTPAPLSQSEFRSMTSISFILFLICRHGKGLSQEPSGRTYLFVFDALVHVFLIPTGDVARQFLLIWLTDFSCHSIDRYFLYTVRTEHSGLSMGTEHQLLTLFFHWTLDGLGFLFWGRCHDRCIPQQNSRSCFSSSVWLMSSRQDDMSPKREPCGKELILQLTEFTLL